MVLCEWAITWGIPAAAVQDLQRRLGAHDDRPPPAAPSGESEAAVQARRRVEATQAGGRLWRNNVGAAWDAKGNPIRFGLANTSKQQNARIKSADLVGCKPVLITPAHVGRTLGVFWSREIKPAGWHYAATPREQAQLRWAELIVSLGGDAKFDNGDGPL